jgi:hemolysin activation/secretion protein
MLLLGGSSAIGAPPEGVIPSSLTPSSPVNNPGRQLLQQTQPQATSGRPAILAPSEENAAAGNPNEPKFFIHKIQVSGVTRLSSKQLDTIVQPYEERPLGVSDINVLMGALTQAYVKRGYITTRVYLPQQNIQNGVLRLRVLEGRLEAFSGRGLKRSQLFSAFPILPGDIIRLAGLEQGLDQLERPSSVRATTELIPGRQEGSSTLALNTTSSFPVHLDVGVDNLGNPITGVWRWTAEGGIDNLLRLNDVWQASYQRSDHSNAVAGTVIFPFRWWTFTTSASYSAYSEPLLQDIRLYNDETTFSQQVEQVIYRNVQHRVAVDLGFDWTQTTREALGDTLNPIRTSSFSISFNDTWQLPNHTLYAALTYQEGVPIFGVHQDRASLRDEDPHAEFHLLKPAASLVDTSLKWVNWRSDLTAQFSFEGLLSDQQLYLSDPVYLRGWNHAIIGADSGFVWRNEFDFHLLSSTGAGQPGLFSLAQWERALTPYVYNDLGYASTPVQDLHHFFGAAGAGLRLTIDRLSLDGYFAYGYGGDKTFEVSSPTLYLVGRLILF